MNSLGIPNEIDHTTIMSTPVSLISRRFTFSAPADNNASITGYSYILCQYNFFNCNPLSPAAVNNVSVSRPSFIIGNLSTPEVPYLLRILAINEVGMGPVPGANEAHLFNSSSRGKSLYICSCICLITDIFIHCL